MGVHRTVASLGVFALAVVSPAVSPVVAQIQLSGVGTSVHLVPDDMTILEAQIPRKDLPCEVKPADPVLGFDLRFHTGYDVTIPLKELAGNENLLSMLFRVTPEKDPDKPMYFTQHIRVPPIDENASGESTLGGIFDIGEGKYHVDWLMKDRAEHVCAFFWDSNAELAQRDKEIELAIAANTVEPSRAEQFLEDPPVQRNAANPLNVKVLVNFAPQNQNSSAMRPIDTLALVTVMRRITHEPRFGKFSVVAFNIQEQRVLYRQSSENRIDFPALGKAIADVQPGVINMKLLANKRGEVEFLTDLIKNEMSASDRPDALIFAGPKYMVAEGSPEDELKAATEGIDYPIFYLNYNLSPQTTPWRDSIGRAIRVFGGKEYAITRPRDLFFAVTEMVSRVVESRQRKGASR
ncbi:MAG: acetyltransferase [Acidobacteriota bacterium]